MGNFFSQRAICGKTKSFPGRIITVDGSSSIFSTTTIIRVAVIGREKEKVYTLLRCLVFLPKISVKQWRREKLQKGSHNFHIFLFVFLFSRNTLKLNEKQEKLYRRAEGMLPLEKFENLHAVMAILVLFKQFSRKFSLNYLTLILSASPNLMHFVCTFSIMPA